MNLQVTDDNLDEFLGGWHDNRVRALVAHSADQIRLRYLLTAYHYRDRVSFGYVLITVLCFLYIVNS